LTQLLRNFKPIEKVREFEKKGEGDFSFELKTKRIYMIDYVLFT